MQDRRARPRKERTLWFVHNGVFHFYLLNTWIPPLGSDQWIEVVW